MLVILRPNTNKNSDEFIQTWDYLSHLQDIQLKKHVVIGEQQTLTEIYLIGDTSRIDRE